MRLDPRLPALVLFLGFGCARLELTVEGDPAIVGVIVARDLEDDLHASTPNIHVKQRTDDCGIIFAIGPETRIVERGGALEPAWPKDLTVGRTVAVWARVVLDSCPGQAGAETVEILY